MLKIGICRPSLVIRCRNSDLSILNSLEYLFRTHGYESAPCLTISHNIFYNLKKIVKHFLGVSIPVQSLPLHLDLTDKYSLLVVYGNQFGLDLFDDKHLNLLKTLNIPVLWITGFPTATQVKLSQKTKHEINIYRSKFISTLSRLPKLHAVFQSKAGIDNLLTDLYDGNEIKNKLHYVPFYLPWLESVNPAKVLKNKNYYDECLHIVFCGNPSENKGLPVLIKAVNNLDENSSSNIRLTIVTKDDIPSCSAKDINHIRFAKHQHLNHILSTAHIVYMCPSKPESYGLILVEAMANGCTIITDKDETRIAFTDNSAFYVEPNNVETLTELIYELQRNRHLVENSSRKLVEKYLVELNPNAAKIMLMETLHKVISR